jgi:hypothetical protein
MNSLLTTILLLFILLFSVLSFLMPFYSTSSGDYAVVGIQNSGVKGCLGYCQEPNNNCVGDDASPQCQVVQGLYLTATAFIAMALITCVWDIKIMNHTYSQYTYKMGIKSKTFASFSLVALVLLFIAVVLATQLPEGFGQLGPISQLIVMPDKKHTVAPELQGAYKEGFYLTIVSILLLFVVTGMGYGAKFQ